MTTYIYPTSTRAISDNFAAHVARHSVNPGTDYECPFGTPVYSVASGVVTDAHTGLDGSGGERIHVNHDDNSGADYLHLSGISVRAGQVVKQGQLLGYSGASAYDSPHGDAPHLHISFRYNHTSFYGNVGNVDFDAIMTAQNAAAGGGAKPLPPEEIPDVKNKYSYQDRRARALSPGISAYLTDDKQQPKNIVGAVGANYSITTHFAGNGFAPGDSVNLVLEWHNNGKVSRHYTEIGEANAAGVIAINPTFKRGVVAGDSVFLLITANAANKKTGEIQLIDSDAWLFS